jgi:hypothetical protein
LAGSFAYAKYQLTDRVSVLARSARALCMVSRAGALPSGEQIGERFIALADEQRLQISDMRVVLEPLKSGHGMEGALQNTLSSVSAGKLKMDATVVTVSAHVHGKKWLWSIDRDVAPSCTVQGSIERVAP